MRAARTLRPRRVARLVALLIAAGLGLLLVGLLSPAGRSAAMTLFWREDQAYAAAVARSMTDYTPPPGFAERRALELQGIRSVVIGSALGADDLQFVLTEGAPGLGDAQYQAAVEASWATSLGPRRFRSQVVHSAEATIRGGATTLRVREGHDDRGAAVRQVTAVFAGNRGPVLLMVVGPPERWDEGLVAQFLASLR